MCFGKNSSGWSGGSPPGWLTGRRASALMRRMTMCGEGVRRSRGATRRWYDRQARDGGWLYRGPRTAWARALLEEGPVAWFRWVFRSLDAHDETCRWRRFVERLT